MRNDQTGIAAERRDFINTAAISLGTERYSRSVRRECGIVIVRWVGRESNRNASVIDLLDPDIQIVSVSAVTCKRDELAVWRNCAICGSARNRT